MKSKLFGIVKILTIVMFLFLTGITSIINSSEGDPLQDTTQIILNYYFEKPIIKNVTLYNKSFSSISLQNLPKFGNAGEPLLPFKPIKVLLPPGHKIKKVEINGEINELDGEYIIEPRGQTIPTGFINFTIEDIYINQSLYNSSTCYPGIIYEHTFTGEFRGFEIPLLNLYPVRYNPKQKKLEYYNYLNVTIYTEQHRGLDETYRGFERDLSQVSWIVENPSMTNEYPKYRERNSIFNYIIITSNELKDDFQSLIDYKSQFLSVKIQTIESIVNNETFWVNGTWGDNNPSNPFVTDDGYNPSIESWATYSNLFNKNSSKIRNFIRYAYMELGTDYVLLGGDELVIPHQGFFGLTKPFTEPDPYKRWDIPSDLYYAALNGSFNRHRGTCLERTIWAGFDDGDGYVFKTALKELRKLCYLQFSFSEV